MTDEIYDEAWESLEFQRDKKVASVMVWGAMSGLGISKLYFFEESHRPNSQYYCDNILQKFHDELHHRRRKTNTPMSSQMVADMTNFIFQQDGAPIHRSNLTQSVCSNLFPQFIDKNQWPG